MKNFFGKIVFILGVVILGVGGVSPFLVNQQSVQKSLEGYLLTALEPWAEQNKLIIRLDSFEWEGVLHPLSFKVANLEVKGLRDDLHFRGEGIRVGIKTLPLLLGNLEFSRLQSDRITFFQQDKTLLNADIKLHRSWQGKNLLIINGICQDLAQMGSLLKAPFSWDGLRQVHFHLNLMIQNQKIVGNEVRLERDKTRAYGSFALESDRSWRDLWNQGGRVNVEMRAQAQDILVNEIAVFWPKGLAPKPRSWVVENLEAGNVPNATLNMEATIHMEGQGYIRDVKLAHLGGEISAHGVTVHYLRPMLPVLETNGKCTYTDKQFLIEASGNVNQIKLDQARILISDLDQEDQMMDIHLENEGPVEDSLNLLKSEPLDLTKHLGLDTATIKGRATVKTDLHFPLMVNLPLNQVEVKSHADLRQAQIQFSKGPGQYFPVKGGAFKLDVDKTYFQLEGKADIAGWPSLITWEQYFDRQTSPYQQRLKVQTFLKWPLGEDWGGEIPVDCTYENHFSGKSQGHLKADLMRFALSVPWILWDKKINEAAHASVKWSLNGGRGKIDELQVIGSDIAIQAHGDLDGDGLKFLEFSSFRLGDLNPKIVINRKMPSFFQLGINLKTFDISGLLSQLDALTQTNGDFSLPVEVALNINIDQLLASDTYKLSRLRSDIRWARDRLGLVEIKADTLPDHKPFVFRLTPSQAQGVQEFHLQTSQAGELFELLGTGYDMEGGDMVMVGHKSNDNQSWRLTGEVQLKDLVVREAPLLAQLLSLTSFQGIMQMFTGKGILFSHGHGHFSVSPSRFEVNQSELSGSALGVFFQGQVNRLTESVNFTGELVPVYGMNQLMARIPLLGQILSGGNQQGIFRTAFSVKGKKNAPEVKVNALTSITPGGVRAAIKAGQNAIEHSRMQPAEPHPQP